MKPFAAALALLQRPLKPDYDKALRRVVLATGVTGAVLFSLLLAVSWLHPILLETWARNAIAQEVQQRVETKLDALNNSAIGGAAGRMMENNNREAAAARARMAQTLPSRVSLVIEAMLNPECPCRSGIERPGKMDRLIKRAKQSENASLQRVIVKIDEQNAKLTTLIESKYRDVAQSLLGEIRIFSTANAAVFLLLAITAGIWKRSALQLIAPGLVLVGAAAITATMYLFNQDWLQTILLNDYVGLWYFPYLGLALVFMLDAVFNRGRLSIQLATVLGLAITAPLSAGC